MTWKTTHQLCNLLQEKTQETGGLSSRKEEHTAVIGSRQHYDDLYSHLLDNESWQTLVERHDTSCTVADWDEAHVDCMLWTVSVLTSGLIKTSCETTGGRAIYEMVYLTGPSLTDSHLSVKR